MKKTLMVSSLILSALLVDLHAGVKRVSTDQYQTATVVSVDKHVSESNFAGSNPSDAPLQASDYSYDIGIRLGCDIYVGRYHSAINYLPSVLSPHHTVDVRFQKHIMYISVPNADGEVRMGRVGHRRIKQESCSAKG